MAMPAAVASRAWMASRMCRWPSMEQRRPSSRGVRAEADVGGPGVGQGEHGGHQLVPCGLGQDGVELHVHAQGFLGGQVLIGPGEDILKLDQVCGAAPQGGQFGHQRFHGAAQFCHVLLGARSTLASRS